MEESDIKKGEVKDKINKKDFILILVVIFILSGATYWHFKNWRRTLKEVEMPKLEIPKFELPELKTPEFGYPSSFEEGGYKEWGSPDGSFKMRYPSDWLEMEKGIFENIPQEGILKGETLFFAQKLTLETPGQAFLTVQKLILETEVNFEGILEEMKKAVKEKGGEMEISELKINEKTAAFEANYKGGSGLPLHSKEKIVSVREKILLVSFLTFESNWSGFQKEAEEIIDSVTILE